MLTLDLADTTATRIRAFTAQTMVQNAPPDTYEETADLKSFLSRPEDIEATLQALEAKLQHQIGSKDRK